MLKSDLIIEPVFGSKSLIKAALKYSTLIGSIYWFSPLSGLVIHNYGYLVNTMLSIKRVVPNFAAPNTTKCWSLFVAGAKVIADLMAM